MLKFNKLILVVFLGCIVLSSCEEKSQIEQENMLNKNQTEFYKSHKDFFDKFDRAIMNEWIKMIDFDKNSGKVLDSKVLYLEKYFSEEQVDDFIVELCATPDVKEIVIYDEDCNFKTKINPKYQPSNLLQTQKTKIALDKVKIWKRRSNNKYGGCDFSFFSICAIRGDDIEIMN